MKRDLIIPERLRVAYMEHFDDVCREAFSAEDGGMMEFFCPREVVWRVRKVGCCVATGEKILPGQKCVIVVAKKVGGRIVFKNKETLFDVLEYGSLHTYRGLVSLNTETIKKERPQSCFCIQCGQERKLWKGEYKRILKCESCSGERKVLVNTDPRFCTACGIRFFLPTPVKRHAGAVRYCDNCQPVRV